MQLVLLFLGSGGTQFGNFNYEFWSYAQSEEVRLIIVAGDGHLEVGDWIFPNLKDFAERFTQTLFVKSERNTLVLGVNDTMNSGIGILYSDAIAEIDITGITLCGASRGAVTCFEVARVLNKLAPDVSIDIIADQPVPGNLYQAPYSNAASIMDCRDLTNVSNVSIILGAYTGEMEAPYPYSASFLMQSALYILKLFHLAFFSQIVPKLSATTNRELIVTPQLAHDKGSELHIHMLLAKSLLRNRIPKTDEEEDQKDIAFKQGAVKNRTKILQNSTIYFGYNICFAN